MPPCQLLTARNQEVRRIQPSRLLTTTAKIIWTLAVLQRTWCADCGTIDICPPTHPPERERKLQRRGPVPRSLREGGSAQCGGAVWNRERSVV